jgi:hypothetical protein
VKSFAVPHGRVVIDATEVPARLAPNDSNMLPELDHRLLQVKNFLYPSAKIRYFYTRTGEISLSVAPLENLPGR